MSIKTQIEKVLPIEYKTVLDYLMSINPDIDFYLVGGMIRDVILDYKSLDVDLVVASNKYPVYIEDSSVGGCHAISVANHIRNTMSSIKPPATKKEGSGFIKVDGFLVKLNRVYTFERYVTAKLKFLVKCGQATPSKEGGLTNEVREVEIDLATPRKDHYITTEDGNYIPSITFTNIEDDTYRRDFNVNAIAVNMTNGEVVDKFNGIDSLKYRIFSTTHSDSFNEDPSRIIRGIRFSSKYKLKMTYDTIKQIETYKHLLIKDSDYVRIEKEVDKIPKYGHEFKKFMNNVRFYGLEEEMNFLLNKR